jgi:hypothetical protein
MSAQITVLILAGGANIAAEVSTSAAIFRLKAGAIEFVSQLHSNLRIVMILCYFFIKSFGIIEIIL